MGRRQASKKPRFIPDPSQKQCSGDPAEPGLRRVRPFRSLAPAGEPPGHRPHAPRLPAPGCPLRPLDPLRDLPALPRSSDFSSDFALSNISSTSSGCCTSGRSLFTSLADERNLDRRVRRDSALINAYQSERRTSRRISRLGCQDGRTRRRIDYRRAPLVFQSRERATPSFH